MHAKLLSSPFGIRIVLYLLCCHFIHWVAEYIYLKMYSLALLLSSTLHSPGVFSICSLLSLLFFSFFLSNSPMHICVQSLWDRIRILGRWFLRFGALIESNTMDFFCVACGKEFLLKKSALVEEPDSAISQVGDFQNIVSLYKHQSVHWQNGNTPLQIVLRLMEMQ